MLELVDAKVVDFGGDDKVGLIGSDNRNRDVVW